LLCAVTATSPAPRPSQPGPLCAHTADGTKAYSDAREASLAQQLYDGGWHMATVTSQPGGGKGYRLFLDGTLVNEVRHSLFAYLH